MGVISLGYPDLGGEIGAYPLRKTRYFHLISTPGN